MASYAVLWMLVLALCIVVVALARQVGTLHLRLGPRGALEMDEEGPPLGEAPVPTTLDDIHGRAVAVGGPGEWQVLAFATLGCHLCAQILPSLPIAARVRGATPIVIVDSDVAEAISEFGTSRSDATVIASRSLPLDYAVPGTPYIVVLDNSGIVRSKGTVNNLEQLEGLIDTGVTRAERDERLRAI
jgi:methylamine dehydrogenase accessory protein MauD